MAHDDLVLVMNRNEPDALIIGLKSSKIIGMPGVRLEGNFHIITGHTTAIKNIKRCVNMAGLQVSGLVLEPVASSESVLNDEEKEAGVALIDSVSGQIIDLNTKYCEIVGYDYEELAGHSFSAITYPEDLPADAGADRP